MKRVRVRDLKSGQAYGFLYCWRCQQSYSADRGDYFMTSPTTVLACERCDTALALVKVKTTLVEVA